MEASKCGTRDVRPVASNFATRGEEITAISTRRIDACATSSGPGVRSSIVRLASNTHGAGWIRLVGQTVLTTRRLS